MNEEVWPELKKGSQNTLQSKAHTKVSINKVQTHDGSSASPDY